MNSTRTSERQSFLVMWIVFTAIVGHMLIDAIGYGRDFPPCEVVCNSCDMAYYQAHELKTREPDLFKRDRIFAVHHSFFPRPYALGMNFLSDLTGNRVAVVRIALLVLGLIFLAGIFLLNQRLIGNPAVASLAVLLAVLSPRGSPYWGLPHLKPREVIGAASPLLLYWLFRGIKERGFIQLFTLAAAALVYIHPPAGLLLYGVGAGTFLWLGRNEPHFREGLLHSTIISLIVFLPLVIKNGPALHTPPSMEILIRKAQVTFFPTRTTFLVIASEFVFPFAAALLIYPLVRSSLTAPARAFLKVTAVLGISLVLFSSLTYLWTGMARFVLSTAFYYAYPWIFVVMALGLYRWREFSWKNRIFIWLAAAVLLLNLDGIAVVELQNLRHHLRSGGTSATESPAEPVARNDALGCLLAEAGEWARTHTERDDLFLIPPREVDAGFRVLSHRAMVVTDKDGGGCLYDGETGIEWMKRIKGVGSAYLTGSRPALESVARQYAAQYILVPRKPDTPLDDAAFVNDGWVIWPTHIPIPQL